MLLRARAPAKVNLSLHVLGRRADGFHELDSIVAFAGCAADALTLTPGPRLGIEGVDGPFAGAAGPAGDNLVLKAARAAQERTEGLVVGLFFLTKRIPVAAGLGGGSADAAAALRLLAEANDLATDDPRLVDAAVATGSDVTACLVSRAARMTGRGERIEPIALPPLAAVLANPLKGVSTMEVFGALGFEPTASDPSSRANSAVAEFANKGRRKSETSDLRWGGWPSASAEGRVGSLKVEHDPETNPTRPWLPPRPPSPCPGEGSEAALATLAAARNDLEPPARKILPAIGLGLEALAASQGCRLARMSGSGATVFGLYEDSQAARRAARALRERLPGWWVLPSVLR